MLAKVSQKTNKEELFKKKFCTLKQRKRNRSSDKKRRNRPQIGGEKQSAYIYNPGHGATQWPHPYILLLLSPHRIRAAA